MDLFSLVARLTLDRSRYEQGISEAEGEARSFGDKLKSGLGTAAKVGTAALAAVGNAAVATTTALVKQAGEVAAYGDNIDKASQKLGISAEAYQEWDAVLQHSGTSIDSMGIGMKTLANKAAEGSDAFTALGISAQEAASMSREELFSKTITALQNVTDENQRAQLAQELFGRSAMELGPLLNTSAEETQAMKDRVHELGGVMSDEAVKAAAAYQDNLKDMQTAMSGVKRSIVSEFIPGLSNLMSAFTNILAGEDPGEALEAGIDGIVGAMDKTVDKFVTIGQRIIPAIVDAIVKAAPALLDGASKLVLTLGQAIIANLPNLVKAGLEVIVTLANAIAASLPELIPTIVSVVMEIVDILTEPDTLAQLVEAAVEIIAALAEGIFKAVPKLYEKIPDIVINIVKAIITSLPKIVEAGGRIVIAWATGIVNTVGTIIDAVGKIGEAIWDGIGSLVDSAAQWGRDMIDNFIGGIKSMWDKAKNAVSDFAGMIKDFLGFSEPEEGPLSDFHTYAPDMMQLFAKGIKDNEGVITDAISGAFNLRPAIASSAAPAQEVAVSSGSTAPRMLTAIFQFNGSEFARMVTPMIEAEQARVGVRLSPVTGGAY